jgi:hypothetical protein
MNTQETKETVLVLRSCNTDFTTVKKGYKVVCVRERMSDENYLGLENPDRTKGNSTILLSYGLSPQRVEYALDEWTLRPEKADHEGRIFRGGALCVFTSYNAAELFIEGSLRNCENIYSCEYVPSKETAYLWEFWEYLPDIIRPLEPGLSHEELIQQRARVQREVPFGTAYADAVRLLEKLTP